LRKAFVAAVEEYLILAEEYFSETILIRLTTFGPFEPLTESVFPIKNCPIDTLPVDVKN
jgi:hypothetical protein